MAQNQNQAAQYTCPTVQFPCLSVDSDAAFLCLPVAAKKMATVRLYVSSSLSEKKTNQNGPGDGLSICDVVDKGRGWGDKFEKDKVNPLRAIKVYMGSRRTAQLSLNFDIRLR